MGRQRRKARRNRKLSKRITMTEPLNVHEAAMKDVLLDFAGEFPSSRYTYLITAKYRRSTYTNNATNNSVPWWDTDEYMESSYAPYRHFYY